MHELRAFMFDEVYLGAIARREHEKVDRILRTLFDAYCREDGPPDGGGAPGADLPQRVTDYLAGMTDRYCLRAFAELSGDGRAPDLLAL